MSGADAAWLDAWIEREFGGYGVAVRKRSEPAIPGEPFMSMEVAKSLTRRAVEKALTKFTDLQCVEYAVTRVLLKCRENDPSIPASGEDVMRWFSYALEEAKRDGNR